ncbi:nucleotidyltransferase domain-containing protein [Kerstersia sp.]|uniref:nucleotidyltransferase domain-containing protein n=1 Tax=Kerstersia sp. TaxID=1930783 RepID=UPI003F8F5C9B
MKKDAVEADSYPWQCWRPEELARRLHGQALPWCVVGGWALDLWHGRQTREHEDLEFTVLREDLAACRHALAGLSFYAAGDGRVAALRADEAPSEDIFQVWCLETAAGCWRADMMVEPGTPAVWAYKREPALTRPRQEMVGLSASGIPFLLPAGVLLFKAKYRRPKDEQDFELALPTLPATERAWLRQALMRLHPGHEWIGRC